MSDPASKQISAFDWSALFLLSFLWGLSFIFAKIGLEGMRPFTLVFGRVLIGALGLALFLIICKIDFPKGRANWIALCGMGLLNNVFPFSLLFYGQMLLPHDSASSLSSILNATTPISTMLLAHYSTKDERLDPGKVAGLFLGVMGVFCVFWPRLNGHTENLATNSALLGMILSLLATLSYAASAIYARRFRSMSLHPAQISFGQLACSSLCMALIAAIADRPWELPPPGLDPILALLALGLISTGMAYVIFFWLMARIGPSNVMLVTLLTPVHTIILAALFTGEQVGLWALTGMALIGLGLLAIDGRLPISALRRSQS